MPDDSAVSLAERVLLEPFDLSRSSVFSALYALADTKVDDADVYFQARQAESWGIEEGIVKSGSFSIDQGFGVRVVRDDKSFLAHSDVISLKALNESLSAVKSIGRQGISVVGAVSPKVRPRVLYSANNPLLSLSDHAKVEILRQVDILARAKDRRIVEVMASLVSSYEVILIARLDGLYVADVRPLVRLSVRVVAQEGGRREQGSSGGGGRYDCTCFSGQLINYYVDSAVSQALVNLSARPAPAGSMTVVLGSGWPGILLHEAIGHCLEGDFNRKGSSAFSGLMGQRVAAPGVTVLDDGTVANRRGSLNIDDEGTPTQATVLIEDGILRGYMHDRMNARLMNTCSTGNGRRESYSCLPMPRMTNTYMVNGTYSPEEIIASVKRGVYAKYFEGGQVDITSGKFVFSASQAYWVENGKICYPVKGATLIGSGPEVLKKVSMIGHDMAFDDGVGTCGKDGQSVPVGVGQPTLRLDQIVVGGVSS
ncbi:MULTISPECIES: metalloprotease TldD [Candidatus Ichthyocystis]|uniref:Peptidase TldD n=1 Tax=Candidatus Ichthyocystis hellenicum TaxID=1561003 RepID=A0A0S4M2S0_9BURK|nr:MULTISPECIES: metalloprotease TldD [Ichthyocystis]CUT17520.1 peptidase TldD [Candidatus Ichthyocystis hellenicum]